MTLRVTAIPSKMPSLQRTLTLNFKSKIRSPLLKKSKKSRTESDLSCKQNVSVTVGAGNLDHRNTVTQPQPGNSL